VVFGTKTFPSIKLLVCCVMWQKKDDECCGSFEHHFVSERLLWFGNESDELHPS
jgi:hypothetical protein